MKHISSIQNPLVKSLVQLQEKSRERKKTGTFLIEGRREIMLARKGGYTIESVLFTPELLDEQEAIRLAGRDCNFIEITTEVYQKLAYRDSTEGILAVAQSKELTLERLSLPENPLVLVAEAPEKPGNIGALLRTADAAALDAVIIANPKSDMYNPNIIRSGVGCLFTNQLAVGTTEEVIQFLRQNKIDIYCATLQDAKPYHQQNYTSASALVVGTEATGLTQDWRNASRQNIMIPMQGQIDSMNVSVAAAVMIFEAKRQRGF